MLELVVEFVFVEFGVELLVLLLPSTRHSPFLRPFLAALLEFLVTALDRHIGRDEVEVALLDRRGGLLLVGLEGGLGLVLLDCLVHWTLVIDPEVKLVDLEGVV